MHSNRHLSLILMFVCGLLAWVPGVWSGSGSAIAASIPAQVTHTDALGRQVQLDGAPQRVVSLVPSVTETIYALGAQGLLVGVTDFCNYPPQAQNKQSVGAYDSPSIEAIAMLRPDLVIIAADMATPALLQTLLELDIPVYSVYPRSLKATIEMQRNLGAVLGYAEAGATLASQLEQAIAQLNQEVNQTGVETSPRVLLTIMLEPLVIAGTDTLPGEMLACAGGINVASPGSRYPMWNMESVLAFDPDIIIVSPHPGTSSPRDFFLRFKQLRAVQQGNVVEIPADWLQRPGPRIIKGLEALRQAITDAATHTPEKIDATQH